MTSRSGFTLIELSIVLVIIGLIVGGVLVGQDLVAAATVRSQVTQMEKYNAAVNTFRGKYGFLPGDMPDPDATRFGFTPRGLYAGQGDGNGLIQGTNAGGTAYNGRPGVGEPTGFWVDLSTAGLIDGSFNTLGSGSYPPPTYTGTQISLIFPQAKIPGNYIYIWVGGVAGTPITASNDANNYYAVAPVCITAGWVNGGGSCYIDSVGAGAVPYQMTVGQAYNIDKKMDDGYPRSGIVQAVFINSGGLQWANPVSGYNFPGYSAISSACQDTSNGPWNYTVKYATNPNCALSFKFQ